jgi:hypothetical protein
VPDQEKFMNKTPKFYLLVCLAFGGCTDAEAGLETDELTADTTEQAVGGPQTIYHAPRSFGGNIFAENHYYVPSENCSPGYVRSGTPGTQWVAQQGGFCNFERWVTPANPRDCRAVFHAYTAGGWFGGTCHSWVNEVPEVLPPNLALFKPATQSSTPWGADAGRAVDGNPDGNWYNSSVTHTDFDAPAWWQVDLGAVKSIGEVVLYNRTDCCSERLANFEIMLSSTGTNWQTVVTVDGQASVRTARTINASGRFLRVQLRGTNYLSLAEVQVYAP